VSGLQSVRTNKWMRSCSDSGRIVDRNSWL